MKLLNKAATIEHLLNEAGKLKHFLNVIDSANYIELDFSPCFSNRFRKLVSVACFDVNGNCYEYLTIPKKSIKDFSTNESILKRLERINSHIRGFMWEGVSNNYEES